MFTVRHYSPDGYETLYEATEVGFAPAHLRQQTQTEPAGDFLWYQLPTTKEIKSLERGMVYVMNETGATVSKYELSPPADRNVGALAT